MNAPSPPLAPFVVAEDSADDLFFLKRGLKQAGLENPVMAFENGRQAVAFLEEKTAPLPCLILLDIKMPVMSGFEVLAWAKKQSALAPIPIVMLSGSTADSDMARARELGAAHYLVKPAAPERLAEIAREGGCSGVR